MSSKRNRSPAEVTNLAEKCLKQSTLLSELPIEIVECVLSFALPAFTSSGYTEDDLTGYLNGARYTVASSATPTVLTHPLLQTNKLLRQLCLRQIHRATLWVQIDEYYGKPMASLRLYDLPWVPQGLTHLIQPDAAILRMRVGESPLIDDPISLDTLIFPFSIDRLLYLINMISYVPEDRKPYKLVVQGSNLLQRSQRSLRNFVAPAFSALRNFGDCEFKVDAERQHQDSFVVSMLATRRIISLRTVCVKAERVVQHADGLTRRGHGDEADLLCFSSLWIVDEAKRYLSNAYDWARLEEGLSYHSTRYAPACCQTGNELRGLVHKIEYRARVCFTKLVENYRHALHRTHPWLDAYARYHFRNSPSSWFGLDVSESIELYYGRAICFEAYSTLEDGRYLDRCFSMQWSRNSPLDISYRLEARRRQIIAVKEALHNMGFAAILDPDNDKFQMKLREYKQQLASWWVQGDYGMLSWRMVVIRQDSDALNITESDPVIWVGDSKILQRWGGKRMLRNLPLARKGLPASSTFAEWGINISERFKKQTKHKYFETLECVGILP